MGLLCFVASFIARRGSGIYTSSVRLSSLVFMILCDVQLLCGLLLYFGLSHQGYRAISDYGMGEVMKDPNLRRIAIEHFVTMLLAVMFVHIGMRKVRKATEDKERLKKSMYYTGIALILILAGIPWTVFLKL
jgi:hypothetical protein